MTHAPIAVSCGEPAGVGPEIAVKAWQALRDRLPFFWLGDPAHLPAAAPWREIADPAEAAAVSAEALPVLKIPFAGPAIPGQPRPEHAASVIAAIARGVALVQAGKAAALTTAPINKKALKDGAGFAFPGHTEY
ncbi:4-hydroxythreonine-4-phosphate dehydrogenase, partial [Thioclava sp. BHET1]